MKALKYQFNNIEVLNSFLETYLDTNSESDNCLQDKTVFDLSEAHTELCLKSISNWITKHNQYLGYYEDNPSQLGHELYCSASGQGSGFFDNTEDPNCDILQAAAEELENIAMYTDLFY